jgi:hypothetical protein
MSALGRGLYEVVITEALGGQLIRLEDRLVAVRAELRAAEAADRVAMHIARVVERAVAAVDEDIRPKAAIDLARHLINTVIELLPDSRELATERPLDFPELLRSIAARLPDGRAEPLEAPLIPLLDTTLLTNAPGEPRVGHQILTGSGRPTESML